MPRKGTRTLSGGYGEAHRLFPLAGVVCQQCAAAPATDRHHVDRNPQHNTPKNVRLLCEPCHFVYHPHMRGTERQRALARVHAQAVTAAAHAKRGRTHCKHGHPFTPANTYVIPGSPGGRQCKACKAALQLVQNERQKLKRLTRNAL